MQTKTREITRRRFTVHDYHRMAEAGILCGDDRVELIEGEVFEMAPIGVRHFNCVNSLNRILVRSAGDEVIISVQNPIPLDDQTEPQPDLAIIRARDYRDSLPGPGDVRLLIGVSDTTLAYDREVKLPLYACAGIPEVWIVDLENGVFERHTTPSGDGYRHIEKLRRGDTARSATVSGLAVVVDAVLG